MTPSGDRRAMGLAAAAVVIVVAIVASATFDMRGHDPGAAPPQAVPLTTAAPAPAETEPDRMPPPPRLGPSAALTAALDPVWRDTPGGCISVMDGDRVVYEANDGAAVVPASVTKLFTAAAALDGLGADARLRTVVRTAAPPVDGVVAGDLWLIGGGDPVLGTEAWAGQLDSSLRLYTSLDVLADRVVAAGIRHVEGGVVGDESRYDADRYVDTWPDRLIADGEAGPLSALAVNDGFLIWGHPGVPFDDPPTQAAAIFAELLVARGVTMTAPAAAGRADTWAVEVAAVDSPTVGELVHAMLRDSDNGTAELLVKELGLQQFEEGSTAAGVRAVRELVGRSGIPLAGVTAADGSGLSEAARLTCTSVTMLLTTKAADLARRLAVAGQDGTLARRFLGTPVAGRLRAKTGSLDGVAALGGYVDNSSGTTLAFAYVVNGLMHDSSARSLQDALAAALVTTPP
jgi:D-alanyl-D-alanine carboxypeptidase/D-alanyl-D-alanine-endopeptidase (penicillin-binding protein 4)